MHSTKSVRRKSNFVSSAKSTTSSGSRSAGLWPRMQAFSRPHTILASHSCATRRNEPSSYLTPNLSNLSRFLLCRGFNHKTCLRFKSRQARRVPFCKKFAMAKSRTWSLRTLTMRKATRMLCPHRMEERIQTIRIIRVSFPTFSVWALLRERGL